MDGLIFLRRNEVLTGLGGPPRRIFAQISLVTNPICCRPQVIVTDASVTGGSAQIPTRNVYFLKIGSRHVRLSQRQFRNSLALWDSVQRR